MKLCCNEIIEFHPIWKVYLVSLFPKIAHRGSVHITSMNEYGMDRTHGGSIDESGLLRLDE